MLIEFSIENFRSIKNKITLSLEATTDKSLDKNVINKLINIDKSKEIRLFRSVVIYGANASGKTNVLFSLVTLGRLVVGSHKNQRGDRLPYHPFKFDENTKSKPTKFEVTFIQNNVKYLYSISYNAQRVIDEHLYYYPKGKKAQIFERKNTNDYEFNVDKKDQNFIAKKTLENVLYISNATQLNYDKASIAFDWFKNTLGCISANEPEETLLEFTIEKLNKDLKFEKPLLRALEKADVGIQDVEGAIKKTPLSQAKDFPYIIKKREEVGEKGEEVNIIEFAVKTFHEVVNEEGINKKFYLDFAEESHGTKRLFMLMGPFLDTIEKGKVLVIDELDKRLHHLLSVFIITLFHDPEENKNNAQLIFATHNTSLLDQDLFRRDQIWFTERDPEKGNTELYSLAEYSPRKDKNIQKGYLAGRYGALPFIGDEKVF